MVEAKNKICALDEILTHAHTHAHITCSTFRFLVRYKRHRSSSVSLKEDGSSHYQTRLRNRSFEKFVTSIELSKQQKNLNTLGDAHFEKKQITRAFDSWFTNVEGSKRIKEIKRYLRAAHNRRCNSTKLLAFAAWRQLTILEKKLRVDLNVSIVYFQHKLLKKCFRSLDTYKSR